MKGEYAVCSSKEAVDVFDIQSGSHIRSFNVHHNQGHFQMLDQTHMLVMQSDKPIMQVWDWATGDLQLKFTTFPKITRLAVSSDRNLLAAGSEEGKVFVWCLRTGTLLKHWNAHYQAITAIVFTSDDSFLVTGGEDALVTAWPIDESFANPSYTDAPDAFVEWSEHTLKVTDLSVGVGGACGRLASCSLDRTCKLWDISSKTLLASFALPSFLTCCTLGPCERYIYCGGGDGKIHKVDIMGAPNVIHQGATFETEEENAGEGPGPMIGHTKEVTSLSLSFDATTLVSGSLDGTVRMWDTNTRQLIQAASVTRKEMHAVHVAQGQFDSARLPQAKTRFTSFVALQRVTKSGGGGAADTETTVPLRLRGHADDAARKAKRVCLRDKGSSSSTKVSKSELEQRTNAAAQAEELKALSNELEQWKSANRRLCVLATKNILNQAN